MSVAENGDPYLWDEKKVAQFKNVFDADQVSACHLKCPDRRGLVAGLYTLNARLAAENLGYQYELEGALIDAELARRRVARMVGALRRAGATQTEIQWMLDHDLPEASGEQEK